MFPKLQYLDARFTRNLDDLCLSELSNLRELDISSCNNVNGDCFSKLAHLSSLSISRTNLGKCEENFKNLHRLRKLHFVHDPSIVLRPCRISEKMMKNFPNLTHISAFSAGIQGPVFKFQKNLRYLDITCCHGNTSSNITSQTLENLNSLDTLIANHIQRKENPRFSKIEYTGNIPVETFKKIGYSIQHLEIQGNFLLSPDILEHLPNLKKLAVSGCSAELCQKSLEISKRLDLLKICSCPMYKPVFKIGHYKPHVMKDRFGVYYTCPKCDHCQSCNETVDPNTSINCASCEKIVCKKKCKTPGTCEYCSGVFCKECRTVEFSRCDKFVCEYESLCSVCKKENFHLCQICKYKSVCTFCGNKCEDCENIVCRDCLPNSYCALCKEEIEREECICAECFVPISCHVCNNFRNSSFVMMGDIYGVNYQKTKSLCEECAWVCPICEQTVCDGEEGRCVMYCGLCERTGCVKCMNGGELLNDGYEESPRTRCDECGSICKKCRDEGEITIEPCFGCWDEKLCTKCGDKKFVECPDCRTRVCPGCVVECKKCGEMAKCRDESCFGNDKKEEDVLCSSCMQKKK